MRSPLFAAQACGASVLLFALSLLLAIPASAQESGSIDVLVVDEYDGAPVSAVAVELLLDGEQLESGLTDAGGRISFSVALTSSVHESERPNWIGYPYPNPAAGPARLPFIVDRHGVLLATTYDVLGRQVLSWQGEVAPGSHMLDVDLSGLPSGLYLLRILTPSGLQEVRSLVRPYTSGDGVPAIDLARGSAHLGQTSVGKASGATYEIRAAHPDYDIAEQEVTVPVVGPQTIPLRRTPPRLTHSGDDIVSAATNEAGDVRIVSTLEAGEDQYDLTIDVRVQSEDAERLENVDVHYGHHNEKLLLLVRSADHSPGLFYGTPEELVNEYGGELSVGTGKAHVVIFATVALAVTVGALALGQIKLIKSVYGQQRYYMSDNVEVGEDYIENCKTFSQVTEFIGDRVGTVTSATSIVVTFVSAGASAGASPLVQIVTDAGMVGAEAFRDMMLDAALEAYGVAADQMLGEKVLTRAYFDTGGDASARIKNIIAPFEIIYDDPRCSGPSGDPGTPDYTNSIGMEFVRIPAGTFQMGDAQGEGESDELPVHDVTISRDFYMGRYEVTQAQWEAVMGDNPSYFTTCGGECPLEWVSWSDVQSFVQKLNEMEATTAYRLPTEAEWEYAARAGTDTRWSFGDDQSRLGDYAWYSSNSIGTTLPVGQKEPNPWGLYDVHGNVWEWVLDWYGSDYYANSPSVDPWGPTSGAFRVNRGGSWFWFEGGTRSANRNNYSPSHRFQALGFRLLRMSQ